MWYMYTMEYYSDIKKNEIMPFAGTWMDLEIIILSEIKSDRQRQITNDITFVWYLKTKQNKCTNMTKQKETQIQQTDDCQRWVK